MRTIALLLTMVSLAQAQTDTDRDEIREIASGLNDRSTGIAQLFTSDADIWTQNGRTTLASLLKQSQRPWSEIASLRTPAETIRFLTQDVALVDAEIVQYGSVTLKRSIPLLLVMKKERGLWRVASYRMNICLAPPDMPH